MPAQILAQLSGEILEEGPTTQARLETGPEEVFSAATGKTRIRHTVKRVSRLGLAHPTGRQDPTRFRGCLLP